MSIQFGTTKTVREIYVGTNDDQICLGYVGRNNTPFFARAGEAALYTSHGYTFANAHYQRPPNRSTWVDWWIQRSDFQRSPIIPKTWIQSPAPNTDYTLARFRIFNNQGVLNLQIWIGPNPSSIPATLQSTAYRRLLSSIESSEWTIRYGSTDIDVSGPGSSDSQTTDTGDGVYSWRPSAAASTALRTLLDGLLDGSITDSVQLIIPGLPDNAPAITNFQAAVGASSGTTLTVNDSDLPETVTITADIADATSWDLIRVANGTTNTIVSSSTGESTLSYTESFSSTFKPDSNGWSYNLIATNSALGNCGTRHATIKVRVVTAPTIASMSASPPASSQTALQFIQCSTVTWAATAGDPPASWEFTQSGFQLAHVPSSRHATPGQSPQRVCTVQRPGQTTTLTLTGTNEAGSASRSVSIPWVGGH